MKLDGLVLRIVGGTSVIVAALGLFYTATPLQTFLENHEPDPGAPHFFLAFTVMTGICITCYALLAISGVHFLRGRTQLAGLFAGVLLFEVIYSFVVVGLWMMPKIGGSVAAATGVANGGLVIQAMILFPCWAPFAVYWARRRQK